MIKNCLICGVGGQGVVLASKLMAEAAMSRGFFVRTAETIGMSQRGGSVASHVRWGDGEELFSPMISKKEADLILAFEPSEAVKALPYLKKDGVVVSDRQAVPPVTSALKEDGYTGEEMCAYLQEAVKKLYLADSAEFAQLLGTGRATNVVFLGIAAAYGGIGLTEEDFLHAVDRLVKKEYAEMNRRALALGISAFR